MKQGPLFILSGPSGSGKSTVLRALLEPGDLPLRLSVSATTRSSRPGELDGKDYWFWTMERFLQGVNAGAFLEHAQVHGNYYGTLRDEVFPYRDRGQGVILEIDTQGAAQVLRVCPESILIFLRASSLEEYEKRLRKRHTETEASIERRLAAARGELACADRYHYQVVNDEVKMAVARLREIVQSHLQ